ncbi:MAG: NAD(P)/FAD-dependent oxidoreductase [Streptosporangiaceae bacterium]|jgi:phytoene dehydrogenase-like protein
MTTPDGTKYRADRQMMSSSISTSDVDVVVIGAGNAGLVAAVRLAQSGAATLLLEQHNIPGGCATSFRRGRFEFEVALHQLSGLGTEKHPFQIRQLLGELGVLDRLEFVYEPDLYRVTISDLVDVTMPADKMGVVGALAALHPAERQAVRRFLDLVHDVFQEWNAFTNLGGSQLGPDEAKKKYPLFTHYALRTLREVLDELFVSQTLKTVLAAYWDYLGQTPANLAFIDYAVILEVYLEYKPAHIKGGSQAMSNALLDQFLRLGGEVRFNCGADAILTEDGRVKAVRTVSGDTISCRAVVSNASTPVTYGRLLDTGTPEAVRQDLASRPIGVSGCMVYLGLDATPQELGMTTSTNFCLAGFDHDLLGPRRDEIGDPRAITVTCYSLADPSFSPPGTTHLVIMDMQYSEPWTRLSPSEYLDVKFAYGNKLIDFAERTFPGLRDTIVEADVATPITVMRYLRHPGGAIYGFDQTPSDSALFRRNDIVVPGLYLAGAWAGAGGFQPTLTAGVAAADAVLNTIGRNRRSSKEATR